MQPTDELFPVLIRLRLGLLEQDLAHRFNIGIATVSHIFVTWIKFLNQQLRPLVTWPSRADIDAHMPAQFKEFYPSTHVIIDCTEVFTEVPSSMSVQSLTYFSYKHNNTFKGLVGILPQELLHLFLIYMLALYLIRHLPVIVAYWNLLSLVTQLWPTKALTLVTMCYFVVQSLIFPHF